MKSVGIKAVKAFMAAMPAKADLSIAEKRALMDQATAANHLPRGCTVERTKAGECLAEWIKPPEARPDAVVLYLHGGGYVLGSLTSHRQMIGYIAKAAGVSALSLEYRLAPEHPFPAAIEDAVSAYRWLLRQGFVPGRIVIAGDSAGGGLTMAALIRLRDEGDTLPAAGVCLSPWVDLTCSSASCLTRADAMLNLAALRESAALYLDGRDPGSPLASPLYADLTGLPPLLIQVGSEEMLLDDAAALYQQTQNYGVQSILEVWDEMIHVWHAFSPVLVEGREAIARIGSFIKMHMGKG